MLSLSGRRSADLLLVCITSAELSVLLFLTPGFTITDWIYVAQHILVLGAALTRQPPRMQDHSLQSSAAVAISYMYPYAQVIYLHWIPGIPAWPALGFIMVTAAACWSLISLLALGKRFGVRPALRELVTKGPYSVVRHPIYLAYVVEDIGYNFQEWNFGTVVIVIAGWASLLYRIHAEERILSHDPGWANYAASVRCRLLPGLW